VRTRLDGPVAVPKEDGKAQEGRCGVTDKSRVMLLRLPSYSVFEASTTLVGAER